ncbi:MAG: hypothetical protein U1C51_01665, partial [Candidatus Izemoplasmatales bacterium]|nr:hypothetical protein [Candidatus Izemoplasmatales bacterium]
MFTIQVGTFVQQFEEKIRLETLATLLGKTTMAAKVNNRLRELSYEVGYDATIDFLDYTSFDSARIYATSMRYLIVMAAKNVYPSLQIK